MTITAPLATIMMLQSNTLPDKNIVKYVRSEAESKMNSKLTEKIEKIEKIEQSLPVNVMRAVSHAKLKGASNWLSTMRLEEQGSTLTKGEFRDALALRYAKDIRGLPSKFPCGPSFNINHALNCKRGDFVILRHNNIRDFEANLRRRGERTTTSTTQRREC